MRGSVGEDIARFLSELIKIDTSNPPGNETEAARLVYEKLSEFGITGEILESEPGRGSFVASVDSGEPGPTVLLLSHLDVVPADPREWKIHPFSGEVRGGFVWGRGALDCKGLVAVELFVFAELVKRERFKGRLVFAATADEEKGGKKGVGWLVENRPELLRADYAINEGGGFEIKGEKGSLFVVQAAEKGVYWFKVTFKGEPGHASMPLAGDNALVKASDFISAITKRRPRVHPTPHVERFIKDLLDVVGKRWVAPLLLNPYTADTALAKIPDRSVAALLDAMLRNTLTPTIIRAGQKENIIPSLCELTVDCRLLPGYDEKWVKTYLDSLGIRGYEIEFLHKEPPSESSIDTPLYEAIEKVMPKLVPGARVTTYMSTGGTDSRYLRWKYGTAAYGFSPIRSDLPLSELLKMVHGVDERISIANLEFGYKALLAVLREFYSAI